MNRIGGNTIPANHTYKEFKEVNSLFYIRSGVSDNKIDYLFNIKTGLERKNNSLFYIRIGLIKFINSIFIIDIDGIFWEDIDKKETQWEIIDKKETEWETINKTPLNWEDGD